MPKIPVPDFMSSPATEALQPPRIDVDPSPMDAVGRGFDSAAQGVGNALQAGYALYKDAKDKADEAAVATALTAFTDDTNDAIHNPNTGLTTKKGDAALAASDDVYGRIATNRQRLVESLGNDTQKRGFTLRSGELMVGAHKSIEEYAGQQRYVAQEASSQGLQSKSLDALAKNFANPELRAQLIEQPVESIKRLARSSDEADAKVSTWRKQAYETVINGYLSPRVKDYEGADKFFNQVKGELGVDAPQFEHVIDTMREKAEGDQTALAIINRARKPNDFIDVAKAVSDFETLPADKRTPQTEESFHKYLGLEKAAQEGKTSDVFNSAFTAYLSNHSLSDVPATTQSWLTKNAPGDWRGLEQMENSWGKGSGTSPQSTGAYISIAQDIEKNPLKYKGMDAAEFNRAVAPLVSEQDWKDLGRKFSQAQKAKDFTLPVVSTVNEIFQHAFSLPKSRPDTWPQDKQELWRDVHDYVEKAATAYIRDNRGKQPGEQELERFVAQKLAKGTVVGGGLVYGDAHDVTRVEAEHKQRYLGKQFIPNPVPGAPPTTSATPAATAPAATPQITRTKNGRPIIWNGSRWVYGG